MISSVAAWVSSGPWCIKHFCSIFACLGHEHGCTTSCHKECDKKTETTQTPEFWDDVVGCFFISLTTPRLVPWIGRIHQAREDGALISAVVQVDLRWVQLGLPWGFVELPWGFGQTTRRAIDDKAGG